MSAHERDFSNFRFEDSVYELADGLIPRIAVQLEVELPSEPNADALQSMLNKVGKKKELRDNTGAEDYMSRDDTIGYVEQSGLQRAVDRDIWMGETSSVAACVHTLLMLGGVANWTDRMVKVAEKHSTVENVWTLGGKRKMELGTEVTNPSVDHIHSKFGVYPTEGQYIGRFVVPKLLEAGKDVLPSTYPTNDADTMLNEFFSENPHLLEEKLLLARVANSGIIMALQLREAARNLNPDFDTDPTNPQLFVVTDSFPIARTVEEEADAPQYQKSAVAIRQVILTGKKLILAQEAEKQRMNVAQDETGQTSE